MSLIKFTDLKESLKNLHTKDSNILSRIGLKKMQNSFSAYSAIISGNSCIILIPDSVQPDEVAALSEFEAALLITVLGERGEKTKKWVRIWPEENTD